MKDLCIQIHPHRAPALDVTSVRAACEELATDTTAIEKFDFIDGTDGHYYVNLMFATGDLRKLWSVLQRRLYGSADLGRAMMMSSMAMCEGDHGWDDYLLLHHFNPTVPRDTLPETDTD